MKRVSLFLCLIFYVTTIMVHADNVLLNPFKTTNGTIPFDKISIDDYEPAIKTGIIKHCDEINSIVKNNEHPTFENTIVALERSGETLKRALYVLDALSVANADDKMMAVYEKLMPVVSNHYTNLSLNEELWKRVNIVYEEKDKYTLTPEETILLENTYKSFVRNGAKLEGAKKEEYKKLNERLTVLTTKFSQNATKGVGEFVLWLKDSDLQGLPESTIEAAKMSAKDLNNAGGDYAITLQAPSYMSFMKYSSRRDLRETLYRAYNSKNIKGEYSNVEILKEIADTRRQIAQILGYKTHADYVLENTMAENKASVYNLLNQLKDAYKEPLKKELADLTKYATKLEGKKITIMPWDYSYYFNKLKEEKFSLNDEELRPYFELNNVIKGVFGLATKLYGVTFVENYDAQVYHPEVRAFNVLDKKGEFLGLLYTDFFPRATKQSGAWMTNYSGQYIDEKGKNIRPMVTIVMNFTRPTETKPSLLTYYEVETFLHEFGHSLHGLLTQCKYESISGTSVEHDFVELPSQFNENYLSQKEFLQGFAKHYSTGQIIPDELIEKVIKSSQFGAAYACYRQLGFGFLDMAWYDSENKIDLTPNELEAKAIKNVEIFPQIEGTMISPSFTHIFSGGYSAGYYGYKWAEVIDADAFSKFLEDGIFNQETAKSFLDNILTKGGSEKPMVLYKRFRGKEPSIEALLKRDGIKK